MPTEHLLELRKGIELARDALSGDHGAEIMIERALKAGSLFLTGGAIAAGLYQLIPLLLVPAFPEIMPGLKAPTQARDEKLAITNNIHAELKAEFERRSVISTNVETSPPPQHFSVPE